MDEKYRDLTEGVVGRECEISFFSNFVTKNTDLMFVCGFQIYLLQKRDKSSPSICICVYFVPIYSLTGVTGGV